MLPMVSYSRRPQSGQITCYLNRTYHVLLTHDTCHIDLLSKTVENKAEGAGDDPASAQRRGRL